MSSPSLCPDVGDRGLSSSGKQGSIYSWRLIGYTFLLHTFISVFSSTTWIQEKQTILRDVHILIRVITSINNTSRWGEQTDRNGRWSSRIQGSINYSVETLVGGQKGSVIVSINIFIGRRQQWTIPVNRNHFGTLFICKPRLWSTEVRVEHVILWGTNWLHFRHMIFKYLRPKPPGLEWHGLIRRGASSPQPYH